MAALGHTRPCLAGPMTTSLMCRVYTGSVLRPLKVSKAISGKQHEKRMTHNDPIFPTPHTLEKSSHEASSLWSWSVLHVKCKHNLNMSKLPRLYRLIWRTCSYVINVDCLPRPNLRLPKAMQEVHKWLASQPLFKLDGLGHIHIGCVSWASAPNWKIMGNAREEWAMGPLQQAGNTVAGFWNWGDIAYECITKWI